MNSPEQILNSLRAEFEQHSYGQHPAELYDPIRYIMSLDGKRFRPLLTLLATSIFTNDYSIAIKPAMAMEVFHNFTLMHDDIMDNAPLRRGQPAVHEKWNPNTAILSGDVMLVKAYDLLLFVEKGKLPLVLRRFNKTAAEVCEGQQLDMNFEKRWDVHEVEYLEMIRLKTSVLLGFSLELGGILGGADEENVRLLYEAGESMGIGFQLKDDLLDVYGDPSKFGKQVGGDILANKKTFLLIEALGKAQGETKAELQKWIEATEFDPQEKVNAVRAIYDELDIRSITQTKIDQYFSKGFLCLEALKAVQERKEPLMRFAKKLVERDK